MYTIFTLVFNNVVKREKAHGKDDLIVKKRLLFVMFVCVCILILSISFAQKKDTNISIIVSNIIYLGDFVNKQYEPMPGEPPVKLPIKINSWPGNFYDPPDVIKVEAIIKNNSKLVLKNVIVNIKVRYKAGKEYNNKDGIDVEKSKANSKWLNNFIINKDVTIKSLAALQSTRIQLVTINLEKDMEVFEKKGERPWECETRIALKNNSSKYLVKKIPIEVMYD
jgi:hypothetical protein